MLVSNCYLSLGFPGSLRDQDKKRSTDRNSPLSYSDKLPKH